MTQTRKKSNNLAFLNRDRGYRFVDRDPVMEEICAIITASGKTAEEISQLTAKESGGINKVNSSTITNWLKGKTKKPQNFTVTWVGYVLGKRRAWINI